MLPPLLLLMMPLPLPLLLLQQLLFLLCIGPTVGIGL
jgi:hypothetical protein